MGILMKNGVNYSGGLIEVKPEIYSEEEREIGVWTDGRPLYQKTIKYQSNSDVSDSDVIIDTTIKHGDTHYVTNIEGVAGYGYMNTTRWAMNETTVPEPLSQTVLHLPHYGGGTVDGPFVYCSSDGIHFMKHGDSNAAKAIILTIKYTKKNDTPGSGLWSTTGAPTHHYSQNEQIVGTWIDGKPVYEKCFPYNNVSNDYIEIDVSNLSIERVIFSGASIVSVSNDKIGSTYYVASTDYTRCWVSTDSSKLCIARGINYQKTDNGYIILQYTKTTD